VFHQARGLWTGDPPLCAALLHCQENTRRVGGQEEEGRTGGEGCSRPGGIR
jgi:hypothetical protein